VRFGLDRGDGEVQATIPFDPVDGTITRDTFIRALRWLPWFVDFWHPVIDRAIRTGELPGLDRIGDNPEIARMIAQAGGIEQFVAITSRSRGEEVIAAAAATADVVDAPRRGWAGWRSLVTSLFFA